MTNNVRGIHEVPFLRRIAARPEVEDLADLFEVASAELDEHEQRISSVNPWVLEAVRELAEWFERSNDEKAPKDLPNAQRAVGQLRTLAMLITLDQAADVINVDKHRLERVIGFGKVPIHTWEQWHEIGQRLRQGESPHAVAQHYPIHPETLRLYRQRIQAPEREVA
jgi:hypothetical protein